MFHGLQFGPSDSLSAFKTQFGWVLAGAVHIGHTSQGSNNQCYILTIMKENLRMDDALEEFRENQGPWQSKNLSLLFRQARLSGRIYKLNCCKTFGFEGCMFRPEL